MRADHLKEQLGNIAILAHVTARQIDGNGPALALGIPPLQIPADSFPNVAVEFVDQTARL